MAFNDVLAGTLRVDVTAEISDFERKMSTAKEKMEDVTKSFEERSKVFQTAGTVLAGIGTAITGSLILATKAAAEQETIFNRLKNVVELNGESWNESKGKIDDFIESMQAVTVYGDTDTAGMLNRLMIYTGDLDRAMVGTKLAMDMGASGMFGAEQAARMVGMAMTGNVEILGRYIPEFRASNNEALKSMDANEKAAYSIEVLQKKFGGLAEGELKTFNGSMRQLWNYLGDIVEEIGDVFLPILSSLGRFLADVARNVRDFADAHETTTAILVTTAAALGIIATTLGILLLGAASLPVLTAAWIALSSVITTIVVPAFISLGAALGVGTGGLSLIIAGLVIALGLLIADWENISMFWKQAYESFIEPVFTGMIKYIRDLSNDIQTIGSGFYLLWNIVKEIFTWIYNKITGTFYWIWDSISEFWTNFIAQVENSTHPVDKAFTWIYEKITGAFYWIWDEVSPVFDAFINGFSFIWKTVDKVFTWIYDKIKIVISGIYNSFRWLLNKLGIELPEIDKLWGTIKTTGEDSAKGITSAWNGMKASFNQTMDDTRQKHFSTEADKTKKTFQEEQARLKELKDAEDAKTKKLLEEEKDRTTNAAVQEEARRLKAEEEFQQMVDDADAAWANSQDGQLVTHQSKRDEMKQYSKDKFGEGLSDEEADWAIFLQNTGGDWEAYLKETYEEKMPSAFELGLKAMGASLDAALYSGGVLWNGIEGFKGALTTALGAAATTISGDLASKLSTSVTSALSGMGGAISGLAGQITGLGAIAAVGTIINAAKVAFGENVLQQRIRVQQEAMIQPYYTTKGIEEELGAAEWGFNVEQIYQLRDSYSKAYDRLKSMGLSDADIQSGKYVKSPGYSAFYATLLSTKAQYESAVNAAAAGYGYKAVMDTIRDNQEFKMGYSIVDIFGHPPTMAEIVAYGKRTMEYGALPVLGSTAGIYDWGGVIPGTFGERKLIAALAGEEVLARNDPRHSLNFGGGINVNITGNYINSELDLRQLARSAANVIMGELRQVQVLPI